MPSAIDQRRLRDGAQALANSREPAQTAAGLRKQIDEVHDAIAAMQSLDDLGPEANAKASEDERTLWDRLKMLERRLKELS